MSPGDGRTAGSRDETRSQAETAIRERFMSQPFGSTLPSGWIAIGVYTVSGMSQFPLSKRDTSHVCAAHH